jgi:hypothetical protein
MIKPTRVQIDKMGRSINRITPRCSFEPMYSVLVIFHTIEYGRNHIEYKIRVEKHIDIPEKHMDSVEKYVGFNKTM